MANEDYSTLPARKLLIAIARSCIGAHYLRGGNGEIPDVKGGVNPLKMVPPQKETILLNGQPFDWGTYFTAENSFRRCSGRNGHDDVDKRMEKGMRIILLIWQIMRDISGRELLNGTNLIHYGVNPATVDCTLIVRGLLDGALSKSFPALKKPLKMILQSGGSQISWNGLALMER